MPEITLNGPVIRANTYNAVLRDAVLHSPTTRLLSTISYHKIEVGIREGAYTSWIGVWDQSKQKVDAGAPLSVLDSDRLGMRLKAGQAIVVKVSAYGTPASLEGARVNFVLSLVGGRYGGAKPLVTTGAAGADANSRAAIALLEKQINSGGLADWEEPVQLHDPVGLVSVGTFQARMQVDSATQISLQRCGGCWIEVDGEPVAVASGGIACLSTDGLLLSHGAVSGTAPSASTQYYAYIGTNGQLRLSATAPTTHQGIYYLGTAEGARSWRFCGWVYVNASTQFADSETARELANYYNRRRKRLFTCPGYNDNNAWTTYTQNSATWAKVNGGTGSDVSFIANGENPVELNGLMMAYSDAANYGLGVAVGIDGITNIETSGNAAVYAAAKDIHHMSAPRSYDPGTAGRHTASLCGRQVSGTATIYADAARAGGTADSAVTYLIGWVMV